MYTHKVVIRGIIITLFGSILCLFGILSLNMKYFSLKKLSPRAAELNVTRGFYCNKVFNSKCSWFVAVHSTVSDQIIAVQHTLVKLMVDNIILAKILVYSIILAKILVYSIILAKILM